MLGEEQTYFAAIGVLLTLSGVGWVVRERGTASEGAGHFPGTPIKGVFYGVGGALCQAVGALWTKQGIQALEETGATHASMEASFVRLASAVALGLIVGLAARRMGEWIAQIRSPGVLARIVPASFCGTYLGIWFSLLAFQHTSIGVASTLTSTSPIFVLPLVWFFLYQKVTARALLGTAIAMGGVVLLFVGRGAN